MSQLYLPLGIVLAVSRNKAMGPGECRWEDSAALLQCMSAGHPTPTSNVPGGWSPGPCECHPAPAPNPNLSYSRALSEQLVKLN